MRKEGAKRMSVSEKYRKDLEEFVRIDMILEVIFGQARIKEF